MNEMWEDLETSNKNWKKQIVEEMTMMIILSFKGRVKGN